MERAYSSGDNLLYVFDALLTIIIAALLAIPFYFQS